MPRKFILHHDDSWVFTILYVGLAVALSIWISLFWLLVVVGLHGVLEFFRQRMLGQGGAAVWWEIKLDIALVLFALVLTAYMEVILGAAGLGGATRLGAQTAARAAGWSRPIRGVLLSLDDAAHLVRVAARGRKGQEADQPEPTGWRVGDHIAIWLGVGCLLMILLAPLLTDHTASSLAETLLAEMHPWPVD